MSLACWEAGCADLCLFAGGSPSLELSIGAEASVPLRRGSIGQLEVERFEIESEVASLTKKGCSFGEDGSPMPLWPMFATRTDPI